MVITDELVESAKNVIGGIFEDRDKLLYRLREAESVIHEVGKICGVLDIVGGSNEQLMDVIRDAREQLISAVDDYWRKSEET